MSNINSSGNRRRLLQPLSSGVAKQSTREFIHSSQPQCNSHTCAPMRTKLDQPICTPPMAPLTSSHWPLHPDLHKGFSNRLPSFLYSWLLVAIMCSTCFLQASASALTTNVAPGERLCFYAWVDKLNEKVGFYFAVQSGGSFDIDWTVTDPTDTIVIEGEKERQGDYIFTANILGEYSFCFNNDMSSFSEKFVDFDIMVENEPRPVAPAKPTSLTEQTSSLEDSIYKLSGSLSNIQRTQKYFRTRENRNSATVKDSQNRIFYVNVGTSLLLIGMSFTQVFIVRKFFNSPGKYVRV
ncbi:hypothetical protein CROQUDRAFT_651666 [Cronartium quercuum f. sp. fusiforme G11]|uniref:GOLD domain-containing protein n=1 Tax=Cronartium quercuum f. sp. fusiforme G11 TaxID=708437 RepID=A0A9P6NPW2_9BASI|nr:hypothetical protein CROQUDRAFT_651666 [Cronartium quercuum f. sp. fusiforme G11]